MLLHYFLCWVTWSAFVILQACRICIGSFRPRNVLCDSFFVWRFVLKGFISGFGFLTVLIKSSSVMVHDVSLCIGWFFNMYPTQFIFRVWGVQLCTDQNHFVNCVLSTLSKYNWAQFPLGLVWSLCLHWIPCTGHIGGWIFDSTSALKLFTCTFMILKLVKEISSIMALLVLYYSLVHMVYRGYHIWRKVLQKYIPKYSAAVCHFAG